MFPFDDVITIEVNIGSFNRFFSSGQQAITRTIV